MRSSMDNEASTESTQGWSRYPVKAGSWLYDRPAVRIIRIMMIRGPDFMYARFIIIREWNSKITIYPVIRKSYSEVEFWITSCGKFAYFYSGILI